MFRRCDGHLHGAQHFLLVNSKYNVLIVLLFSSGQQVTLRIYMSYYLFQCGAMGICPTTAIQLPISMTTAATMITVMPMTIPIRKYLQNRVKFPTCLKLHDFLL